MELDRKNRGLPMQAPPKKKKKQTNVERGPGMFPELGPYTIPDVLAIARANKMKASQLEKKKGDKHNKKSRGGPRGPAPSKDAGKQADIASTKLEASLKGTLHELSETYRDNYQVQLNRLADHFEQRFAKVTPSLYETDFDSFASFPGTYLSEDVKQRVVEWLSEMPQQSLFAFVSLLLATLFSLASGEVPAAQAAAPGSGVGMRAMLHLVLLHQPACLSETHRLFSEKLPAASFRMLVWAIAQLAESAPVRALALWYEFVFPVATGATADETRQLALDFSSWVMKRLAKSESESSDESEAADESEAGKKDNETEVLTESEEFWLAGGFKQLWQAHSEGKLPEPLEECFDQFTDPACFGTGEAFPVSVFDTLMDLYLSADQEDAETEVLPRLRSCLASSDEKCCERWLRAKANPKYLRCSNELLRFLLPPLDQKELAVLPACVRNVMERFIQMDKRHLQKASKTTPASKELESCCIACEAYIAKLSKIGSSTNAKGRGNAEGGCTACRVFLGAAVIGAVAAAAGCAVFHRNLLAFYEQFN
eukprot:TRINITY_DN4272_c0_g1_i1.p1 TRINITY_DN4272_c0_g1~~TRINITY_DN4272_c0_g1_i1.p1  ORF type:complete len:591 (+),score=131.44 TRINITY_DN4272_c0_g1_i1:155-1774(+)